MQAPTHILAGVIISRVFRCENHKAASVVLMLFAGLLFHGIFDKLAKSTYHPPNADFHDWFWVSYHSFILITTLVFLFIWGKEYKWGVVFSMLPDIDWLFIHSQTIFHFEIPFYKQPHFHKTINWLLDHVFPFNYLNLLPDNRFNPLACLWEFVLASVLLATIYQLLKRSGKVSS